MKKNDDITARFAYVFYEYDKRLSTNETTMLNAFSYLYNTIDVLKENYENLNNEISLLKNENDELKKRLSNNSKKKERSLWYKICKPFKYYSLLKKKHQLEEEIRIENERKAKERRIAEEKRKAELEKQRKLIEAEKIKKRKQEINNLMAKTKKKKTT